MSDRFPAAGRELDARIHRQLFGQDAPPDPDLPYYSTDLGDSFRVVGALKRLGYRVDVSVGEEPSSVTLLSPLDEEHTQSGATPAEALCHAALAVTEGASPE